MDKHRVFQKSYDQVWSNLVGFLSSYNVQLKTIEKDSGVVYAESTSFSNELADCGTPGFGFAPISRSMTLNVFVASKGDNRMAVTVNTTFREARRFDTTVVTVECASRGAIEAAVLEAMEK